MADISNAIARIIHDWLDEIEQPCTAMCGYGGCDEHCGTGITAHQVNGLAVELAFLVDATLESVIEGGIQRETRKHTAHS